MSDFNALVAELAREKRRMDRIGGLLLAAESRYARAVDTLDRAIISASKPVSAVVTFPHLAMAPRISTPRTAVADRADRRRTARRRRQECSWCRIKGHNRYHCPERAAGQPERTKATP